MKKVLFLVAALVMAFSTVASAGELSAYGKAGIMSWDESYNDKSITETGFTQELGVKYTQNADGAIFEQTIGIWHSLAYYDGYKIETNEQSKQVTTTLGLKTYTGISLPVPITEKFSVGTMAGIGTNTFIRVVPSELWFALNARTGLVMKYEDFELRGGVMLPIYTNDTINLSSVKGLVSAQPKGELSPFAEASVKISDRWKIGAYYEMWKWSKSNEESFTYIGKNPTSALGVSTALFQPNTTVISSGFSLEYKFN